MPIPVIRTNATGTAHPPLTGVMKTSEWYAQRLARPQPRWAKLWCRLRRKAQA